MDIAAIFNELPFNKLVGIEVTDAGDGHAVARLDFSDDHVSNPEGTVAHGGVSYALADTAAGAAVHSLTEDVSPTVDMRIDYLAPATTDLRAEADVVRYGSSLAMVRVEIYDETGTHIATAHGTYKTAGQGEETPWDGDRRSGKPSIDEARD
jgi:uncharacterized protein (TIGR00369 family)